MVGAIGFEPTTPCSRSRCATRLRYAPIIDALGCRCDGVIRKPWEDSLNRNADSSSLAEIPSAMRAAIANSSFCNRFRPRHHQELPPGAAPYIIKIDEFRKPVRELLLPGHPGRPLSTLAISSPFLQISF